MKTKNLFDEAGKQAIQAAVAKAERQSSGEIVPVVVDASSLYGWIGYRAAFLGWLSASVVSFWLHHQRPFAMDYWSVYAFQIAGIILAWIFSRTSWGFRFLVSEAAITEEVLEAAHSAFLKHGLVNTRDRTGVLIFVSLKERRVQILGDKGIHEKVGEGFWRAEVENIARSIHEGKPAEGILRAVEEIGEKLKTHFPRRADDSNELSNEVRTE